MFSGTIALAGYDGHAGGGFSDDPFAQRAYERTDAAPTPFARIPAQIVGLARTSGCPLLKLYHIYTALASIKL